MEHKTQLKESTCNKPFLPPKKRTTVTLEEIELRLKSVEDKLDMLLYPSEEDDDDDYIERE